MKILPWVLVAGAFWGLVHLHENGPVHKHQTVQLSGNQLGDIHKGHVLVRGTVMRVRKKSNGYTVVNLQADDGAEVLVTVAPTTWVQIPRPGARISVEGTQPEPGMVSLADRKSLKRLDSVASNLQTVQASARIVREYPSGRMLIALSAGDVYAGQGLVPPEIRSRLLPGETQTFLGYTNAEGRFVVEDIR